MTDFPVADKATRDRLLNPSDAAFLTSFPTDRPDAVLPEGSHHGRADLFFTNGQFTARLSNTPGAEWPVIVNLGSLNPSMLFLDWESTERLAGTLNALLASRTQQVAS